MVTLYGDQRYALSWLEFLSDACGVFSRSVSSLQYVLSDIEHRVLEQALSKGDEALSAAAVDEADALAVEQTKIAAHDALDAVGILSDERGRNSTALLLESDARATLGSALLSWLQGVGTAVVWPTNGTFRIQQRPRPQVPFELEVALAPSTDVDLTLDRRVAVERRIPLLRAGHPLVDAIAHHVRHDDRGVAFALLRPVANQWPPLVFLRTDFLVSAAADATLVEEAERLGLGAWVEQSIQEVLPPSVETTVCTPDGNEAQHPALRQPYDKNRGDRNLASRPDDFNVLASHVNWSQLCVSALPAARSVLDARSIIRRAPSDAAAALRERMLQRLDREQARLMAGMEASPEDFRRLEALLPDRLELQVDVLGCGVMFLGDPRKRA
jgi:ATP-dependent helicase HepA